MQYKFLVMKDNKEKHFLKFVLILQVTDVKLSNAINSSVIYIRFDLFEFFFVRDEMLDMEDCVSIT